MPALHIRQVDDAIVAGLKRRAARNRRSLEAELRHILREVVFGVADGSSKRPALRLKTVDIDPPTDFGRQDLYDDDD